MKNSVLVLLCAFIFSFGFCTKESGNGTVTTSTGQEFVDDYDTFVSEYCDAADQFKNASLDKKMELAQKLGAQGAKFRKYQERIGSMGAELSKQDHERLEALSKKVNNCAEKFKM